MHSRSLKKNRGSSSQDISLLKKNHFTFLMTNPEQTVYCIPEMHQGMAIILKKKSDAVYRSLSDGKNLAVHATAGVVLVVVIFVLPLPLYIRTIVFFCSRPLQCSPGKNQKHG